MVDYKVYHLLSPAFEMPVEVKLNVEDSYLRIAEPFFEVVHFRTPLFQPHILTVANLYGVPVFHVAQVAGQQNWWAIQHEHKTLMRVHFSQTAPTHRQGGGPGDANDLFAFSVAPGEQPNAAERQMLCAAFAVCCQHVQLLQETTLT